MPRYGSLETIQAEISLGNLSCVSLVRHYLTNISKLQHLNAFVEVFNEEALARAGEIDEKITAGTQGKLAGLVVGIKDLISYKDHSVQAASKVLDNYKSSYSATAVQRLLDNDAIIIGRQNCDEFGMGSSSENSAFGAVHNGVNIDYVAGGSSGGSAVAVQMDMCAVSLGTDTGGSVRQPAAFCGVIGLKPTYSRVSRNGLIAYASSFDTIGIFSNFIGDNKKVLDVISGSDPKDSTSSRLETKSKTEESIKRFCYFEESVSIGTQKVLVNEFNEVVSRLKGQGHIVEAIPFPLNEYLLATYYLLIMAEASSNLSRYDGVRYGHRDKEKVNFFELFSKTRTAGFGPEVRRRILLGTFVLSAGYYDDYVNKAQKVRTLVKVETRKLFAKYQYILSPTAPSTAFKLGRKRDNPLEMYMEDLFTVHASLVGIPAISIPFRQKIDNLPIGLQISANEFEENSLYTTANQILDIIKLDEI